MRVAVVGRTGMLYAAAQALTAAGHGITAVVTAKAAPEYSRDERDFERLAAELGCPFALGGSLADQAAVLRGTDVAVSVNWPRIVTAGEAALFRLGVLNAHAGDLPRYRGNACPNWAILRGEKEIALSVHCMEGGRLDCGRIVVQERLSLTGESTIAEVYQWLDAAIPALFVLALERLERDPGFTLKTADEGDPEGFRCFPRTSADGYIDWSAPALDVHRLIRASGPPFAGAYTYCEREGEIAKLVVLGARLVQETSRRLAVPGQVLENDPDRGESLVACGQGVIALTCCRYEGGSVFAPGREWRSIRLRLGMRAEDMVWRLASTRTRS